MPDVVVMKRRLNWLIAAALFVTPIVPFVIAYAALAINWKLNDTFIAIMFHVWPLAVWPTCIGTFWLARVMIDIPGLSAKRALWEAAAYQCLIFGPMIAVSPTPMWRVVKHYGLNEDVSTLIFLVLITVAGPIWHYRLKRHEFPKRGSLLAKCIAVSFFPLGFATIVGFAAAYAIAAAY